MKTKEKYTSLALSEALKEARAVQESERRWKCSGNKYTLAKNASPCHGYKVVCAAFDCAELLERLPGDIDGAEMFMSRFHKLYLFGYVEIHDDDRAYQNTAAEALGKLLLWCLENGHVEKGD